jgi:uncharacterized glyoxalase superfamily protein PhnB
MGVSPYINFSGNCREAVNFYARVFGTAAPRIMTFGEAVRGHIESPAERELGSRQFPTLRVNRFT